jgi:hypothetical protein
MSPRNNKTHPASCDYLLGFLFDPVDGSSTFRRNILELVMGKKMSDPRKIIFSLNRFL